MTFRGSVRLWPVILSSILASTAITLIGLYFFMHAQNILQMQLRERLVAIAGSAALGIDADTVDRIRGAEDVDSPDYRFMIDHLQQLREATGVRFVYILRRTSDPMNLEFVADADAALTPEELDVNENGSVDPDEEAAFPGELYDISETLILQNEAFKHAVADPETSTDQWGTLVSGYAPIYRRDGTISALLGIDYRAEDFYKMSQRIFSVDALIAVIFVSTIIGGSIVVFWERRRINMLKRINSERSGLLRLTFHQLGEPLTIMKWSLETLRDETDDSELKHMVSEHVKCMDEGLGRLNSIIDTLQLAEKIDLNTLEYLPVPGSLRALIDNMMNEWDSALRAHDIKLNIKMDEDSTLPIDANLMQLVFRQVIVNAIEYSKDHSNITLHVFKNHSDVEVTIEDQGCGIPEKDMPHLFEKYRRASNAHLSKPDGNGLGLYIAQGIIQKAGGHMWVESVEHKGTTVHFTLPLA
jgi:signal transduction histidine kinase